MRSIPIFDPRVEGAIAYFDQGFLERYGADSVFVRSLSDLLTIALAKTNEASGRMEEGASIVLISNRGGVGSMSALAHKSQLIMEALFQEPFSVVAAGAVEAVFDTVFGPEVHEAWLEALEQGDHERCSKLIGA